MQLQFTPASMVVQSVWNVHTAKVQMKEKIPPLAFYYKAIKDFYEN